ncbi:MAG: hypothetical protein KGQ59_07925 [Bdellovibrionales bacterium]|nr:hypothetical protein [Bdellovibrionales bacterium]
MIFWKDFILDDKFGPVLSIDSIGALAMDGVDVVSIMEDERRNYIQETGQERRPARMVGKSSSEFIAASCRDAGAASALSDSSDMLSKGGQA